MEGTGASLWLVLLLNHLAFCTTDKDQDLSPVQGFSLKADNLSSVPSMEPNLTTTNNHANSTVNNGIRLDCFIDTEIGLIALSSAGGLILCLLVAIAVLACQIRHIQRQVYVPRSSRSNMCLVRSSGDWDTDQPEVGGLVGLCDISVMLEEVKADSKMEEKQQADIQEAEEMNGAEHEEGALAIALDPKEKDSRMQSSSSRDSCQEVPRDLENMPLVV